MYWVACDNLGNNSRIERADLDGQNRVVLTTTTVPPYALVVDPTGIAWIENRPLDMRAYLMRVPLTGGTPMTQANLYDFHGCGYEGTLASDGTSLYFCANPHLSIHAQSHIVKVPR